jgi:predicted glycosyltransferase
MSGGNPVISFCATGRSGLGHIRRISNIALCLRERAGRHLFRLVTNAPLDCVTAPERALFDDIRVIDRHSMVNELMGSAVSVVDTAVIPGIEAMDHPISLILRETRTSQVGRFRAGHRPWDLVIVPNPVDHWSPDRSMLPAHAMRHTGWIFRNPDRFVHCPYAFGRGNPVVLVASGGGGSGDRWRDFRGHVDTLISRLRESTGSAFTVVQTLGPRADATARITRADRYIDPGPDLPAWFASADIVLTTAGYNSVLELAALDVPVALFSIDTRYDDQPARAKHWGPLLGMTPDSADMDATVCWMEAVLNSRLRRPTVLTDSDGASRAADAILELGQCKRSAA